MTIILIDQFIQTQLLFNFIFVICIDDDKWTLETKHDKIKIFNFLSKKILKFFNLIWSSAHSNLFTLSKEKLSHNYYKLKKLQIKKRMIYLIKCIDTL